MALSQLAFTLLGTILNNLIITALRDMPGRLLIQVLMIYIVFLLCQLLPVTDLPAKTSMMGTESKMYFRILEETQYLTTTLYKNESYC